MNDLPALPPRPPHGHKGTFGTVCIMGGQCAGGRMMIGGPAMAAAAALRSGCGLAMLAMPQPTLAQALTIVPEATGVALPVDSDGRLRPSDIADVFDRHIADTACLGVGPGLGDDEPQQQVMVRLIAQEDVPLVIDADGLNALSKVSDFRGDFRAKAILTPHPGEFKRLAKALGMTGAGAAPESQEQRIDAAQELAQRLGCIVVLKGRETVVCDGLDLRVNQSGSVALATGGTGDVLTGIIAGLVAQFFKPHLGIGSSQITPEHQGGLSLYQCACIGVHMHGRAAELWMRDNHDADAGMLAGDLLAYVSQARLEAAHRKPADGSEARHRA